MFCYPPEWLVEPFEDAPPVAFPDVVDPRRMRLERVEWYIKEGILVEKMMYTNQPLAKIVEKGISF